MMLKLDNVKKDYNDFHMDSSLQVSENCVTGLIGANGAGKSTMFKSILGLIHIDGGEIEVFGKKHTDLTVQDKEAIGVVLAESTFANVLTVNDVTRIMRAMYPSFREDRFQRKCKEFGIPSKKMIKDFSTGMKAKFKLLIAMSYDARLLILDEPTVGLDPIVRNDLIDEMRSYMEVEGRSILISSHISTDLEGLCDDLYFMQNGKIVMHEDNDVILSNYGMIKVEEKQFNQIDKRYIVFQKRESFGYSLLTDKKQFYLDNYPNVVIEKGRIDDVMLMMAKGERV